MLQFMWSQRVGHDSGVYFGLRSPDQLGRKGSLWGRLSGLDRYLMGKDMKGGASGSLDSKQGTMWAR